MGNEEKSPSKVLQALNLQSKPDRTTEDGCQSPTKKQCRTDVTSSTSLGPNNAVERAVKVDSHISARVSHQSSKPTNGNFWHPVVSVTPASSTAVLSTSVGRPSQISLSSQTFMNGTSSATNDLDLFPELLSGEVDPEKFLLRHGVDIFNNEDHRQELIHFCERMLAQSFQQDRTQEKFTNNSTNVGLSNYLPPLQPRISPRFEQPPAFNNSALAGPFGPHPTTTATNIGSTINRPMFGAFQPRPIQQYQKPVTSQKSQPQQPISAHFFDGQKFVPVQVYVKNESR